MEVKNMEEYRKPEIRSEKIEIGVYGQYNHRLPAPGEPLGFACS